MDKFEHEVRKEIKEVLQNKVELNDFDSQAVWNKLAHKEKKSPQFTPWYWTVLAAATSLFLFLGFLFMTDSNDSKQNLATPDSEEQTPEETPVTPAEDELEPTEEPTEPHQWTEEDAADPKSGMYQLEISEFTTVQDYIRYAKSEWTNSPRADGSDEMQQDIEISVTRSTILYINYFEDQIKALDMEEAFDELQELALSIHIERLTEEEFKIQATKFEEKLFEIEKSL